MCTLRRTRSSQLRVVLLTLVLTIALLILPGAAGAQWADPAMGGSTEQASDPKAPTADDGGAWEIGAEAAGGNLSAYACSEASYLTNRLTSRGWVSRFLYCGNNAWEQDYKRAGAGGTEASYLDTVDLMFYVGHGSTGSFTFDSSVDDHNLTPADCNGAWGNGDNDWVALTSCQVLSDPNRANWAACMQGTHQVLGFITNAGARMGTATQGYQFAYYLSNAWSVTGSWFKACDVTNGPGARVRALGEELYSYNDNVWAGVITSDAVDSDYWWWDHSCGSPLPKPLNIPQQTTMPVFSTPPLSLAEAQAESQQLSTAFGINLAASAGNGSTQGCQPGQLWSTQANGQELELDCNSGLYTFYDMNLWNGQAAQAAVDRQRRGGAAPEGMLAVDQGRAQAIADQFLTSNGLMPSDAEFFEVVSDDLAGSGRGPLAASVPEQAPSPTVWQVIYGRVVTSTIPATGNSPAQEVEWQVVGPGAKLKVYVPTTLPANYAMSAALPISGTVGGWRKVGTTGNRPVVVEQVPIVSEAQILKLQGNPVLEPMVTLNTPPIDAASTEVISTTLVYWEDGVTIAQSELIPVYALHVRYLPNPGQPAIDPAFTYIPAASRYMRPYAKITSKPGVPVAIGSMIHLEAADASQTLAAMGYDASLTFALGEGPYLYEWFVGSIAPENKIGGGSSRMLDARVPDKFLDKEGQLLQTVILRVSDSSSDQRSTTDTAAILLDVKGRLNLPMIIRLAQ